LNVSAEFLGVRQLKERWGVTEKVIYGMRYRGEGPPAMLIGRELRWRLSDVQAWEEANVRAPGAA
jgi:predicted DNA-binding transcriptional regulator AlpA